MSNFMTWFTTYWFDPTLDGGFGLSYASVLGLAWLFTSLLKRSMRQPK